MATQTTYTAEQLKSIGGHEWQKSGMHRMYFDIADLLDIDVETYKSGNICSATMHGERISNSRANRYLSAGKYWVDMADGHMYSRSMGGREHDEIVEALRARIATLS